jgi:monoamine oxidase
VSIIIIGAGLSGLYTAYQLQQEHIDDVMILETRSRTGGRILSAEHHGSKFDMGPAWIWPQMQPRLSNLISKLSLSTFKQHTEGDMLYEKASSEVEQYAGQSGHAQSYRIANGASSLISALVASLDNTEIKLDTCVQSIHEKDMSVHATHDGLAVTYKADKIILALPPRLLRQNIIFDPPLPMSITKTFEQTPTWMAGHCKIMFVYEHPFWREQGLSGEAFSQRGPLSEIYDASTVDNNHSALSAFVGLNSQQRSKYNEQQLIDACLEQLYRLYGESSKETLEIIVKDWSLDPNTASNNDLTSPMQHPEYPADADRQCWSNKLILAGTETALQHGGYLEGALESADAAVSSLLKR